MELLVNHNALADTIARAVHYGKIARDALAPLPAGKHKDALLEVIDFCIERGL
jgi:octaprenyl-diphosphate synthase